MKLGRLVLYSVCILEVVILIYLSQYLYGFRPQLSDYQVFEMEPPLKNVIATSLPFIFGAPLLPAMGAFVAWKVRKRSFIEAKLLFAAALIGLTQMLFVLWFELNLFEGVSLLGSLNCAFSTTG